MARTLNGFRQSGGFELSEPRWRRASEIFDGFRLDLAGEPGRVALIGYTLADLSAPTATTGGTDGLR